MRRKYSRAASDFSLNVVTSVMQANQCFGQNTISDHPINQIKCSRDSVHIAIIVIPINFNPVKPLFFYGIVSVVFQTGLHLIMIQLLWSSAEECYDLDMIGKVYFHTYYTLFSCSLNWWVHNIPFGNTFIWNPRVVQLIVLRPIVLQHRCWDTILPLLVSLTADPD